MNNESLLGIGGGIALGFFGSKLLGGGLGGGGGNIPADIEAEAANIVAFDDLSQVFLRRKPLYVYIHGGYSAGLYAFTITAGEGDREYDNPQCFMSVTPQGDGTTKFEFGGHSGTTVSIYHNGVFKLTVPASAVFTA